MRFKSLEEDIRNTLDKTREFGQRPTNLPKPAVDRLKDMESFSVGAGNRALNFTQGVANTMANLGSKATGYSNPSINLPPLRSAQPNTQRAQNLQKAGGIAFDVAKDIAAGSALSGPLASVQKAVKPQILQGVAKTLPYTVGAAGNELVRGDRKGALRNAVAGVGVGLAAGVVPMVGKKLSEKVVNTLFSDAPTAVKSTLNNSRVIGQVGDVVGIVDKNGKVMAYDTVKKRITNIPMVPKKVIRETKVFSGDIELAPIKTTKEVMKPAFEPVGNLRRIN